MTALVVVVHDVPAPQGSKRHLGRGILVESSAKVRPWREAVKAAAVGAMGIAGGGSPLTHAVLDGPVSVEVTFTLTRPAGHFGTGRNAAVVKASSPVWPYRLPDLDKLARSTLDALTVAGVWRDDARVVELRARKVYPGTGGDALDRPGAVIRVTPLIPTMGGCPC